MLSIDSAKDFYELTQLKDCRTPPPRLLMVGGGVPKNFAQDIVVAAANLGVEASLHKYAIQITRRRRPRRRALRGSTPARASSLGQGRSHLRAELVFAEVTIAFPLITGYAFHKKAAAARKGKNFAQVLEPVNA